MVHDGFVFYCCCSVTMSCLTLCDPMDCNMPDFPPFTVFRSLLKFCPLSQWCHPTISSSVVPFSSCSQSFPASVSFPMSWLFTSGGQSVGASAAVSRLPVNIQGWFSPGLTGLISLQSKGLSMVFSSNSVVFYNKHWTDMVTQLKCYILRTWIWLRKTQGDEKYKFGLLYEFDFQFYFD